MPGVDFPGDFGEAMRKYSQISILAPRNNVLKAGIIENLVDLEKLGVFSFFYLVEVLLAQLPIEIPQMGSWSVTMTCQKCFRG